MAPGYTSISITNEGRDAARRMAAAITGHTGQRISMSDALRVAERLVFAHAAEVPEIAAQLGLIEPPEGNA